MGAIECGIAADSRPGLAASGSKDTRRRHRRHSEPPACRRWGEIILQAGVRGAAGGSVDVNQGQAGRNGGILSIGSTACAEGRVRPEARGRLPDRHGLVATMRPGMHGFLTRGLQLRSTLVQQPVKLMV